MASQRLKRTMRGAMTAGAVMAAVATFSPTPALAAPQAAPPTSNPPAPKTASEAMKQYQALNKQTEQVNEDLLQAKNDLTHRQADLRKANADLQKAKQMKAQAAQAEEQFRGQVDSLAGASFEGARFNQLSALFTGTNAQDFLDRASALNVLASGNAKVLDGLSKAVDEAEQSRVLAADAQRRAQTAQNSAQNLVKQITQHKNQLTQQAEKVRQAYAKLSAADQSSLNSNDNGIYLAPPGAAGVAMQTALAQRGKPYVWGADGPGSFDCSGLTMYAYAAAGISLPHSSRAQFQMGTPVSMSNLQPGDLLFFGSSASSIHHVAMYIGNGKVVHAATSGQPVKVSEVSGAGSDFYGAKRLVSG